MSCLYKSSMKANCDKINVSILANRDSYKFQINDLTIISTLSLTLLGITIEIQNLTSEMIIQKAYCIIYALKRLRKF